MAFGKIQVPSIEIGEDIILITVLPSAKPHSFRNTISRYYFIITSGISQDPTHSMTVQASKLQIQFSILKVLFLEHDISHRTQLKAVKTSKNVLYLKKLFSSFLIFFPSQFSSLKIAEEKVISNSVSL